MPILGSRIVMALKYDQSNVRIFWHVVVVFKRHHLSFSISNIKNHMINKPSDNIYILFLYFYSISLCMSNRINYIYIS